MSSQILLTGAPGNVGTPLAHLLLDGGYPVKVAVRDPASARAALGEGPEYVDFDFERPETYAGALRNVKRLFLVRPPAISDVKRKLNPFIDAAGVAGVEQIVFLSLLGVEKNRFVPHAKVEEHLMASPIPYTMLRPTYFSQNLSTTYRAFIRQGEIPLPTGRSRMSFIDARDIAAVAALALTKDGHQRKAYTLTSREALDYGEVARIFTEELGRPFRHSNPSFLGYRRQMKAAGMPPAMINVTTMMYLIARMGLSAGTTPELEQLLGRPPLTMREFVRDHAACWQ